LEVHGQTALKWDTQKSLNFISLKFSSNDLQKHWKSIERDIDILVTHGPCFNILDLAWGNYEHDETSCKYCGKVHPKFRHWGDYYLGHEISVIKPKAHIFGHVHDTPGFVVVEDILRINASMYFFNEI
jgi:Icc-related predicted phosphoesterase